METEVRSVEDREERIKQIDARLAELDAEFDNTVMSDEARDEWNQLNTERDTHENAVKELKARKARMRQLIEQPGATERAGAAPAFVPNHGDDIYDLNRIRTASRSEEDHKQRLHDNAKRAIERATFPAAGGSREKVQSHVEELLGRVDDERGTLAQRILATGSPAYDRAFGKLVTRGLHALSSDEMRAMSVGTPADGGYAVPYQLDPTIILTGDGTLSPLRQIARVEQIVGKEWQGITSSGITVSRSAEGAPAGGNEFTVGQPTVKPTRVIADVRFSVELDQDWAQLRNEVARLLGIAKSEEEDTAFVTGNGTGDNPFGVLQTLATSSNVDAAGAGATTVDDLYDLEAALPPRFRGRASFLANKSTYQVVRGLGTGSDGGELWVRLASGQPSELLGYPALEASAMPDRGVGGTTPAPARYLLFGDFSEFLIVDRLGMNVELNPHIVDSNGRWTGQRAIVAVWRNSSKILVDNAFRVLNG